ncbi:hypothetical protein NC651_013915 [Populus alba x Populus x berolinensis]|nr:hypothetical protein NC651_013915 [Populus alba x Populus x berolinensis]
MRKIREICSLNIRARRPHNFFGLDKKQLLEFEWNMWRGNKTYGLLMRYWSCSASLYLCVLPFLKVSGKFIYCKDIYIF